MTFALSYVPPPYVQQTWPHARALIKRAIDRGYLEWTFAENSILSGRWQLWLVLHNGQICAAGVTNLDRDTCEIIALGGSRIREWLGPILSELESYARSQGCTRTRIVGRAGWGRLLPAYHQTGVVMERKL